MAHDGGREAEQAGESNQRDLLFGPRGQPPRPAATSLAAQAKHDIGGDISENRAPQDDGERGELFHEQRSGRHHGDGGWTAPHTGGATRQGYTFEGSPQQRQQQQQQQEEQEQLSWAEVRGTIDVAERQRGLRSAYESVEVGRETLEHLDDQKERLERSEMMLDSTRYAIERGARVLRGMGFWGRVRNAFSDEPQVPQDYRSSTVAEQGAAATAHERALDDSPVEGFICPDCRINFDAADALVAHFGFEHTNAGAGTDRGGAGGSTPSGVVGARGLDPQDFAGRGEGGRSIDGGGGGGESDDFSGNDVAAAGSLKDQLFGRRRDDEPGTGAMAGTSGGGRSGGGGGGGVIAEQQAFMAAQDDYLDSVGKAVAELGLLGRNIGASLEGQGDAIERVVVKTEESNDRAAFVTRKAARQAQSSKPKKPTFVMSVALQEASTGLFLTVTGDEMVLQETELRNVCRFDAWQRQDGILGFKSDVTGRWLGQTFLGYLRVSGTSFGKNYEWQADLRRKETTMVCCSANWGAGGYLSVRPSPNNSSRSGAPSSSLPPHDTAAAAAAAEDNHAAPPAARREELGLVDATLANKSRAAVFRVVDCQGYTPQPFAGGRLMRNPAAPPGGRGSGTSSGGGGGSGGAGGGWGGGFKEEIGWNR